MKINFKGFNFKKMGIATKLSLSVALSAFLAIALLTGASAYYAGLYIQKATYAQITAIAEKNSITFSNEITGPLEEARNFAEYFVDHYDATSPANVASTALPDVHLNRTNANLEFYFNGLADEIVKNNPIVMGFSLFLEDDVMAKELGYYRNQFYRSISNVDNHSIPEYYFDEVAYQNARDNDAIYLSNPTTDGKNVYVISYYPIYKGSDFLGAVQVSYNLAYFNELNTTSESHETLYSTLILGNGTVLYSSPNTSTEPGSNYGDVYGDINDFLGAVNVFSKGEIAHVSSDGYTEYFVPVEIGNQTWASITGIEDTELNAGVMSIIKTCLIVAVIGIIAMITVVTLIVRAMIKPIHGVVDAAEKLANGNLDCHIEVSTEDEIGQMANSFNIAIASLKQVIKDIDYVLNELANKNFAISLNQDYVGDFSSISQSMKHITASLNDTLSQIKEAGAQVNSGADQVSAGAQALSQGATEQAASVQELSATINEVSGHVKETADNATEASHLSNLAGQGVMSSNEQMNQLIAAMEEITNTSNEIGKIIKTIDDIAFQTNILALNAAVEAARAGAAGKGFAVVADEVRNLASKSAEAAKNTTVLIESSIAAINNGAKIADATAVSLNEVVAEASAVNDKIAQIAEASEKQALAIAQITMGIEQISAVVQTNSATAEQSAAASEELSGQANMLDQLLSEFKLSGESYSSNYYEPINTPEPTYTPEPTIEAPKYTPKANYDSLGSSSSKYDF